MASADFTAPAAVPAGLRPGLRAAIRIVATER
jgi:hypothetical protein